MAINAAIVGLGWWGKHLLRQMEESEALRFTAAVGSRDAHRQAADAHGLPFTTDLESVLGDDTIQMVVLTTPHALHAQQVMKAAAHGKHVFCEKPLALTVDDALKCAEACEKAGVRLGLGHERRFESAMVEAREWIARGALGSIVHAEASFSHDKLANVPTENWRFTDTDLAPLPMTATGIHLSDLLLDMLGDVTEVYAASPRRDAGAVSRSLSLHLRFASGATGYVSSILETPLYMRLAVFGTAGWLEVRNLAHPDARGSSIVTVRSANGSERSTWHDWNDSVRANLESFCHAVANDAPYPISIHQMVRNVAVMAAAAESLRSARPIDLTTW
ncbi:Gfo/Idh/MocA family protein [Trinickia mobilis]|uniref:Gfo/Idh/MocA family protein n=1 Tax=Trinickia mobilis TaxID=2816356 RepID=UPI001A8D96D9|nr:Gfo/Idh/MocA family oxidoreductase [Trinickia mobilis]